MLNKEKEAARQFAKKWEGKGYEKGDTQTFWLELLQTVLGVENPYGFIKFEKPVQLLNTGFMDAYIPATRVLIEQKSIDKSLDGKIRQSDGSFLSPFEQAKKYITELPVNIHPFWVITCNFRSFHIYDMRKPQGDPFIINLENLDKDIEKLHFLVEEGRTAELKRELEVSIKAGEIIGRIYDGFLAQYDGQATEEDLHALNVLCVRLVFCLYAEDAGLFGKDQFFEYLRGFPPHNMRGALKALFKTLDTPIEERAKFLEEELKAFPYVNGSLFKADIEIPPVTDETANILLKHASEDFDWSEISPTIFGAVFESTLNPETRRCGGMHYTSIENIHKVIDPLFLNDLTQEFNNINCMPKGKARISALRAFQDKLASLTFLDPACGSGNFLTETYLSIRRLENQVIKELEEGIIISGALYNPIKVNINQFYGIEINDFAATVATTALWIAEAQMMQETEIIMHMDLQYLPLKTNTNIVCANALRIDWNDVVPKEKLNYIMGNPPFVGARLMSEAQKQDVLDIFGAKWKNVGNLDYVCCWYKKATDLMQGTNIRTALVSTNSVSQGEHVANLWKPLMLDFGIHIDFAYRTFRWDSEASLKAHVFCVIIGFSLSANNIRTIFNINNIPQKVSIINPYLVDAPLVFVESRNKPLCKNIPEIGIGNQPIDGGFYLFTEEEMKDFIKKEPASEKYFRKWIGGNEFINGWYRYCLWLGECPLSEIRKMPECMKRIASVREFRLSSKRGSTLKLANTPTHFQTENMPQSNYIVIPEVSTDKREYIPIGFLTPDILCSNLVKIIDNANLFHFGVLTSSTHMSWMKVVCGRLGNGYRYSKDLVYNNFPWPEVTSEQKEKIYQTAQAILNARALYPDCSLADLYDENTMPPELRRAHQANDRAVMEAYGFDVHMEENQIVAELMKMYQQLTQ